MFSQKRINIINASFVVRHNKNPNFKDLLDFFNLDSSFELPPTVKSEERFAAMCISVARGNTLERDCDPIY